MNPELKEEEVEEEEEWVEEKVEGSFGLNVSFWSFSSLIIILKWFQISLVPSRWAFVDIIYFWWISDQRSQKHDVHI